MDALRDALIRAIDAKGSLLSVAQALDVEPRTIFMWIAGVETPDGELLKRLFETLAAFGT